MRIPRPIRSSLLALIVLALAPATALAGWTPISPLDDSPPGVTQALGSSAGITKSLDGASIYLATTENARDPEDASSWEQSLRLTKIDSSSGELISVQRVPLDPPPAHWGGGGWVTRPQVAPYGDGVCVVLRLEGMAMWCTDENGELKNTGTPEHPFGHLEDSDDSFTPYSFVNFGGELFVSWLEGASSEDGELIFPVTVAKWTGSGNEWEYLVSVLGDWVGMPPFGTDNTLTVVGGELVLAWEHMGGPIRTRVVDPQNGQLEPFAPDLNPGRAHFGSTIDFNGELAMVLSVSTGDPLRRHDYNTSIWTTDPEEGWKQLGPIGGPAAPTKMPNLNLAQADGRLFSFWDDGNSTDVSVWRPLADEWTALPPAGSPPDGAFLQAQQLFGLIGTEDDLVAAWGQIGVNQDSVGAASYSLADVPADGVPIAPSNPSPPKGLESPKPAVTISISDLNVVRGRRAFRVTGTARVLAPSIGESSCRGRIQTTVARGTRRLSKVGAELRFRRGRCTAPLNLSIHPRHKKKLVQLKTSLVAPTTLAAPPLITGVRLP